MEHLDKVLYYARYRPNSLTSNYQTGTSKHTDGIIIRRKYVGYWRKYKPLYVKHPKFIREIQINEKQRCPIELEIKGNYKILKEDINFTFECLGKCTIIVCYKIESTTVNINNCNNYNIQIKDLKNNMINHISNKNILSFKSTVKYIKLFITFNKGINVYKPLIISY